jgi:hypothetical protein
VYSRAGVSLLLFDDPRKQIYALGHKVKLWERWNARKRNGIQGDRGKCRKPHPVKSHMYDRQPNGKKIKTRTENLDIFASYTRTHNGPPGPAIKTNSEKMERVKSQFGEE